MKSSWTVLGVALALTVANPLGLAKEKAAEKKAEVVYLSSDKATYTELVPGGATRAIVWGDPDMGPSGSFVKFAPGFDAGMHTHTNETRAVVIKGAYLYKDEAGEKRVGPGETLIVPGGHKHWSGGDKKEGALFYNETAGKFDVNPVK
jgi:quercetin dioxygenase-like cupin family protein